MQHIAYSVLYLLKNVLLSICFRSMGDGDDNAVYMGVMESNTGFSVSGESGLYQNSVNL